MPISKITKRGKKFLKPRFDLQARKIRPPSEPELAPGLVIHGRVLNKDESEIVRALSKLQWPFDVQVPLGGANELGASSLDILLTGFIPNVNIEFDGPFHASAVGQAKDYIRNVNRLSAGLLVVRLNAQDTRNGLGHLIDVLQEKVGTLTRVGVFR